MTHTHASLTRIRELPVGNGGGVLLLAAGEPPYYAGLRRAPAETAFEAALTFLAGECYRDIVVATSSGIHLPAMAVDGEMAAGVLCGIWRFRGTPPESVAATSAVRKSSDEAKLDFSTIRQAREAVSPTRTIRNLQNAHWPERIKTLLEEIERRTGWEWRASGRHEQLNQVAGRCLFLMDDQFLSPPPPGNLLEGDYPTRYELPTLGTRFGALPDLVRHSQVDLVILCGSEEGARALQEGKALERWLDNRENKALLAKFPRLAWTNVPIALLPSLDAKRPFGLFYSGASAEHSLYNVLRATRPAPPESPLDEMRGMVGMAGIMNRLEALEAVAREARERKQQNLPVLDFNLNTALYGNPGTGKTMVARRIGRIYGELGLLSGEKFLEATRADLVAGYVGQTAEKTRALCQRALGGVLFIDEAYSLAGSGGNDFGGEAIAELIRWMSEANADLAVIFAGYPAEMKNFLRMNPGLAGRIKFHIEMPDYTDEDLVQIAGTIALRWQAEIVDGANPVILQRIRAHREACRHAGQYFRNAGEVEKLVRSAIEARALRIRNKSKPTREDLTLLTEEDFRLALLDVPLPDAT